MIDLIHIYSATRGKYKKPVPFDASGIRFVDCLGKAIGPPEKHACEHSKHWQWGKGTRNGQRLYYPLIEMFVQKWHMTKKELKEAIEAYDMASLEMQHIIICANCAKRLTAQDKKEKV